MSQDKSSGTSDLRQRSTGLQDAPLPRDKLPKDLQTLVDNEESLMDQIYDGTYVCSGISLKIISATN